MGVLNCVVITMEMNLPVTITMQMVVYGEFLDGVIKLVVGIIMITQLVIQIQIVNGIVQDHVMKKDVGITMNNKIAQIIAVAGVALAGVQIQVAGIIEPEINVGTVLNANGMNWEIIVLS